MSTELRKLRLRFAKTGKVRFVSHRDAASIWERALRRAALPIAYTEGFSPRPKLSFGLALSVGYESLGEYLDINLREPAGADVEIEQLPERLDPALPAGMDVQAVVPIGPGVDSLQQAVTSCTWHIELADVVPQAVEPTVEAALAAAELVITRTRKGQEAVEDVRPGIVSVRVLGPAPSGTAVLEAELATQPRGLRPAELVRALDPELQMSRVVRIHQWTLVSGARQELIPLPAATLDRTQQARAS